MKSTKQNRVELQFVMEQINNSEKFNKLYNVYIKILEESGEPAEIRTVALGFFMQGIIHAFEEDLISTA